MYKNRAAITLFITLAVVVAMLSLVGVIFNYLAEAKNRALDKTSLIEANILYGDTRDALESFIGKNPSLSKLKNIYETPIALMEKRGRFSMLLACSPAQAAVPITWFRNRSDDKNSQQKYTLATAILEDIALKYELKDISKLSKMITDSLNSEYNIEFNQKARLKKKRNYLSFRGFQKILNEYVLESDDVNVYKINWNIYFSFGEGFNELDGNFLSARLISIIFGIDEQIVEEEFRSGHLKAFLEENGGDLDLYHSTLFAKQPVVAMKCRANYNLNRKNYTFNFKYINKKVENFEFIR